LLMSGSEGDMALSTPGGKLNIEDTQADLSWRMDNTPEAIALHLWEQRVMEWLNRTQPPHIAEGVILGYLEGNREVFELAATRMQASEPDEHRRSSGFRRIGEVL
jgi:hypothetical protein